MAKVSNNPELNELAKTYRHSIDVVVDRLKIRKDVSSLRNAEKKRPFRLALNMWF